MGIFSFIKDAGENLFGGGDDEKQAIENYINEQNLAVDNLEVAYNDGKVTVNGSAPTQEVKEKVTLCCGNVDGVVEVENNISVAAAATAPAAVQTSAPKAAPEAQYHDVVSGDTLGGIAKKFYGDASKYPVIFEANRPMLSDPDKIYPGQKLRIPAA